MPGVKVTVDARLVVDVRGQSDELVKALKTLCTHANPQHSKLKAMGYAAQDEPREIRTWKGGPGFVSLPRGVLTPLRKLLNEHGLQPKFEDKRTDPEPIAMPRHSVQLYDYQEEAVQRAIALENCLVRAGTGAGKTVAAMALISRIKVPTIVCVWNAALLEQWEERACREFNIPPSQLGIVRAGKLRFRPITLAMLQSLSNLGDEDRKAIGSYFGAVVCDEVHRFAAKTFMNVVDWMPARYRIGMSANETRKDRKEFLIYDMFGQVAYEVPNSALVEKNFVLDVAIHVHTTGSPYDWYRDDEVQFARLLEAIECDDARTDQAAEIAAREVQAGHQTLVFSQRREHCVRLAAALAARGLRPGMMLGGAESAPELRSTIAGLKSGKLRVAVGTVQAVGTGIDLPAVSRGVLTTPITSNKQLFGQVRGRLCRTAPGKTDAVLHYLYDERAFGAAALRNLDRWNETVQVHNGRQVTSVSNYLNVIGEYSQITMQQLAGD